MQNVQGEGGENWPDFKDKLRPFVCFPVAIPDPAMDLGCSAVSSAPSTRVYPATGTRSSGEQNYYLPSGCFLGGWLFSHEEE